MIVHKDPCPECDGHGVDGYGNDCPYCVDGEIAEEERFDGDAPPKAGDPE